MEGSHEPKGWEKTKVNYLNMGPVLLKLTYSQKTIGVSTRHECTANLNKLYNLCASELNTKIPTLHGKIQFCGPNTPFSVSKPITINKTEWCLYFCFFNIFFLTKYILNLENLQFLV